MNMPSSSSPDFTNSDPKQNPWLTLWGYVRPYRFSLIFASVCSMVTGIGIAMQPLLIKWMVDDGIMRVDSAGNPASVDERVHYTMIFAGIFIAQSMFRIVAWRFGFARMLKVIEGVLYQLRRHFFRHVQGLCFRFHDKVGSGELFNYIMGSPIQSLKTFLQQGAMTLPYQLISWIVALGTLATFNMAMTLITLGMVVVIVMLNYRGRFLIRSLSSEFMEIENSASKYISDMLHGTRAIKLYAMEDDVSDHFDDHVDKMRHYGERLGVRQLVEKLKPEAVQFVGVGLIYMAGAWFCIHGQLAVGEYLAFISSIHVLMSPLMSFMELNLIRGNAEAGLLRIQSIFDERQSTEEKPVGQRRYVVEREDWARREDSVPCVEFDSVSFGYKRTSPVFNGLSCSIPHGQSVALVGESGSGKTTFISLLLRLYDPDRGRIRLNGSPLQEFGLADLRHSFGVVPQAPFLFQGTIRDNITIVNPEATELELRRAARVAHIDAFIQGLPDGYNTWVGEAGYNLSGGQKQRIAIARAVLAEPRYYIFDEATSALDNESERNVQEAMDGLMEDHTTFIIAHRLSTVRHVDRVLVFDDGKIVQDGSFDDLAHQAGKFRRLVSAYNSVLD